MTKDVTDLVVAGRKKTAWPGEDPDSPPASRKKGARAVVTRVPETFVPVKPVLNAVRIIDLLVRARTPVTLSHIARTLGINTSTCLNILRTLVIDGLVEADRATKAYRIGDRIVDFAEGILSQGGIRTRLQPLMEEIAYRYGVTVSLWRIINSERIRLVLSALGDGDMRIQMRIGQRMPRWVGVAGRVMAAYSTLSEAELKERFQTLRWQSPIDFKTYLTEVNRARERGWATDDGTFARGVFSLGVPVFDRAGKTTMACSATMFRHQHEEATIADLAREMVALGRALLE